MDDGGEEEATIDKIPLLGERAMNKGAINQTTAGPEHTYVTHSLPCLH